MSIHLIVSEAEQQAIVNALAFYNDHHACDLSADADSQEQWRLAFKEDNRGNDCEGSIDQLATKIATSKWSVYDYLIASLTETHRQLPDMHPDIPDNLPENDMLEAMAFVAKMKESADRIGAGFVGGFTAADGTKFVMTNMNEEDTNVLTPQSLRESND